MSGEDRINAALEQARASLVTGEGTVDALRELYESLTLEQLPRDGECAHANTRPDPDSDELLCDDCGQRIFTP